VGSAPLCIPRGYRMAILLNSTYRKFIGLSTDAKPVDVPVGSTFYEWDLQQCYITHDGTNWVIGEQLIWYCIPEYVDM